jgi:hypothetical protein
LKNVINEHFKSNSGANGKQGSKEEVKEDDKQGKNHSEEIASMI